MQPVIEQETRNPSRTTHFVVITSIVCDENAVYFLEAIRPDLIRTRLILPLAAMLRNSYLQESGDPVTTHVALSHRARPGNNLASAIGPKGTLLD